MERKGPEANLVVGDMSANVRIQYRTEEESWIMRVLENKRERHEKVFLYLFECAPCIKQVVNHVSRHTDE